ncbi:hypothetical protein [Desertibacillus haloalkaliphilus]|uniref:hypothetical protein n=1 Tax=Desertibacillus haloalkaliphilus TaxID=1328930 RepID=UPI001C25C9C9|nr:hypothetical protein [Desertibacillus haloalkaliphilus]MBU8908673.1 hypothetical protein [Desertibacillus haloalkaliphilus]
MSKLQYLNDSELEKVRELKVRINRSGSYDEAKKYFTEITLIIERARVREAVKKD